MFGDHLRRARERAGIQTPHRAAVLAGLSASNLARYESGENMPGAAALVKLAAVYGCTIDALLGREGAE